MIIPEVSLANLSSDRTSSPEKKNRALIFRIAFVILTVNDFKLIYFFLGAALNFGLSSVSC